MKSVNCVENSIFWNGVNQRISNIRQKTNKQTNKQTSKGNIPVNLPGNELGTFLAFISIIHGVRNLWFFYIKYFLIQNKLSWKETPNTHIGNIFTSGINI